VRVVILSCDNCGREETENFRIQQQSLRVGSSSATKHYDLCEDCINGKFVLDELIVAWPKYVSTEAVTEWLRWQDRMMVETQPTSKKRPAGWSRDLELAILNLPTTRGVTRLKHEVESLKARIQRGAS